MNSLLQFAIRKLDEKSTEMEARSETGHRIPDGVQEFLDVPFQGAGGSPLAVDIFRAEDRGLRPLPVVVMVHGGGLAVSSRKMSRTFCENLAARGFLVFAPEYRKITETDIFQVFGDVTAAYAFVSGALEEYGGDPDRVAVVSESAGAFLSVFTVAASASSVLRKTFGLPAVFLRIRALACFSGMFYSARRDPVGLVYSRNLYGERRKDPSLMQYMNPEHPEVMDHLPPVFLVGSEADFLRSYTKRYDLALREAGHPCSLLYYENNSELTHSFPALKPDLPESADVQVKMVEWLGRVL